MAKFKMAESMMADSKLAETKMHYAKKWMHVRITVQFFCFKKGKFKFEVCLQFSAGSTHACNHDGKKHAATVGGTESCHAKFANHFRNKENQINVFLWVGLK